MENRLTAEDIDQIIEGLDHFCIGPVETDELKAIWQPYIDKLHALKISQLPPASETPRPGTDQLTTTQKMFVLLAEIRQCINDDNLMAAQRKVFAIEDLVRAGLPPPHASQPETVIVGVCRNGAPHYCPNCDNSFTALIPAAPHASPPQRDETK